VYSSSQLLDGYAKGSPARAPPERIADAAP
jgi:hypothetical protein